MSTMFAERPRFYEGQYLGADDLEVFLKYAREYDGRHLLGAHTWGIVAGIELTSITGPAGDVQYLLTPGVAVDGYGRMIVVPAPYPLTSDLFAQQPSGSVNVWIRFDESAFRALRAGYQACDCSDAFERWAESFVVEVGARLTFETRESGVNVGDEFHADAREALGFDLPLQPLACDGAVAAQRFPGEDERSLWLIPVGQVPWQKGNPSQLLAATEADQKASRAFRRQAGLVTEHIYPAGGVIRLRPRWSVRQAGLTTDQICAQSAIVETDLITCDGALAFRELIWLEGATRFSGDARLRGTRLEFQENGGTDYLAGGVPLALQRAPLRNPHNGFDLQVLLGARQGTDGPTRLTIGRATVQGADPCAVDFQFDAGVYVQEDARVGIGTTDTVLDLPLTIRAVGANGDLIGLQAADESLAWQINFGPNTNGLNFTESDPTQTRLFLEIGGSVGIGTLEPDAKLDVRSVLAPVRNALGANKWVQIGEGGRIWMQYGDQLAPLVVLSGQEDPARIEFQQVGAGQETGPEFSSWIGHARGLSRDLAVIGGNLGVATTTPFAALTVQGSLGFKAGSAPMIFIHESGTANAERMVLTHSPAFTDWGLSYRDSEDKFLFLGAGVAALTVELAGSQNIGIGTTTPAERLDVRGNVKLGGLGNYFGMGCVDNVRVIAGRIGATGNRLSGSQYAPSQASTGHYRVDFAGAFTSTPVVVVSLVDALGEDHIVTVANASALGFDVIVRDATPSGGNEGDFEDNAFNFIALGGRP